MPPAAPDVLPALADPLSLVVLLLSFLSAVTLTGWVSSLVAARSGVAEVRAERRLAPDPRRQVDPFGAVAAVLAGIGWTRPVPLPFRGSRGALVAITLSGPLVCLLVGLALLVGLGAAEGRVPFADAVLLQEGVRGPLGSRVLLLAGLAHVATALLSLVPLPPLPGGQLLLGLAPRTAGWQKAELYLVEKNLGLVAVLVLLLLPLGGRAPALLGLVSALARPLVDLSTGLLA